MCCISSDTSVKSGRNRSQLFSTFWTYRNPMFISFFQIFTRSTATAWPRWTQSLTATPLGVTVVAEPCRAIHGFVAWWGNLPSRGYVGTCENFHSEDADLCQIWKVGWESMQPCAWLGLQVAKGGNESSTENARRLHKECANNDHQALEPIVARRFNRGVKCSILNADSRGWLCEALSGDHCTQHPPTVETCQRAGIPPLLLLWPLGSAHSGASSIAGAMWSTPMTGLKKC